MGLYCGIDLHSTNSYVVVSDESDHALLQRRFPNDLEVISAALTRFSGELRGVVVESTYNWYWLVDGLMEQGYRVHLANPAKMEQYDGLKYSDDRTDAAWLARLLRLGLLPEGYIYPKAERGLRDLLRRRSQLVRQRTANILAINNQVTRTTGRTISANRIKQLDEDAVTALVGEADVALGIGSNLAVMDVLTAEIETLEAAVLARARLKASFRHLLTVCGIGQVLALTIQLETGEIDRFTGPSKFASYCRCVDSKRFSNKKKKGRGNAKCGNKYLAWAMIEAANFAIRFDARAKSYYERKKAKTSAVIARKAVAHKLARACYYVMRDRVPFASKRCFG